MVFAFSSAILIVQDNSTQLNQTNFGLCVTELILAIIAFFISFWYSLPYNSFIVNTFWYLPTMCYAIAYNSISIHYYRKGLIIDKIFYNITIAEIVIYSLVLLFEIFIRKCIGIGSIYDFNDENSESGYYSILDVVAPCCPTCCESAIECCGSIDERWRRNILSTRNKKSNSPTKATFVPEIPVAEIIEQREPDIKTIQTV
jgi:hypothetical protein